MVVYLSLMLYTKFVCHLPTRKFNLTQLMAKWGPGEAGKGEVCRDTMGNLRVTIGHLRVTVGHPRVTIGHLRVTKGYFFL